jgi:hypothetical protein
MAALTSDNVLVWIHGRRLGLLGDDQGDNVPSGVAGLVVDGVVFGINLPSGRGLIQQLSGTSGAAPGSVPLTGAQVGDKVLSVVDLTSHANVTADFESTISVVNAIQQTVGTAANPVLVTLQPQS